MKPEQEGGQRRRKANIGGDDADAPASAPPVRYPNRFTSTKQPAKRGRAPGVPNILTHQ
jgi:hypothetical protein